MGFSDFSVYVSPCPPFFNYFLTGLEVLIAFFLPCVLGESPSSSASDVDNLNNQATLEKVVLTKGVSASRTAGNLIVTPRNRFSMQRLLQYVSLFVAVPLSIFPQFIMRDHRLFSHWT